MPLQFATIMGDVVHNIRSAFDHIAVALTCPPLGTGNPEKAYFPTGENREKFITEQKDKMKGASTDAFRFVDELEPYDGGKHSIRALHNLDIRDKHKLLIPTASLLRVEKFEAMIGDKVFSLGRTDFQPNEDGTNFIASVSVPAGTTADNFKAKGDFEPSFEIVFDKGQPLEGQAIVTTLTKLRDVAQGLIATCEAHFRI